MSFTQDWRNAKQQFETTTGKKKPFETVLGAFKKSTGLETALAAVDQGVEQNNKPKVKKGYQDFSSAAMKYNTFLTACLKDTMKVFQKETTTAEDKDALMTYGQALAAMTTELEVIRKAIKGEMQKLFAEKELDPTYLLEDWQGAKKFFEKETGKKKPSSKFMGVFRKSSGLEKALEAFDKATLANDHAKVLASAEQVQTAAAAYVRTLDGAVKGDEASDDYDKQLQALKGNLQGVVGRVRDTAAQVK